MGVVGHQIYHGIYWKKRPSQKTVNEMMERVGAIGRSALHSQLACSYLKTFYLAQIILLPEELREKKLSLLLESQVEKHKYRNELRELLFPPPPMKAEVGSEIYDALHNMDCNSARAGTLIGFNLAYDELMVAFKDKGIRGADIYPWRSNEEIDREISTIQTRCEFMQVAQYRISVWDTYRICAKSWLETYHELLLEDKLATGDLNLNPKIIGR